MLGLYASSTEGFLASLNGSEVRITGFALLNLALGTFFFLLLFNRELLPLGGVASRVPRLALDFEFDLCLIFFGKVLGYPTSASLALVASGG